MNFSSYFVLSTLVVVGIVAHAYVAHEQFYPAVVYLSTDKMCLAVIYNFAFALFLLFGKVLLRVFIGTLRDLEVEQLVDSGRGFLADTILFLVFYAPTIDNREVGTVYLIQYICCVIFMKVFHLVTQIRVSHMFEVGVPRLMVNVKLVALMAFLLSCDLFALQYFYGVASRQSTFFTWILFEALTMSTVVLVSIYKYSVHMVDLRLDNGWPGKSVCLFYVDLAHDVVSMMLYLIFMLAFFVQNPSRLPIYMMADVIQVARKLAQRLRSFRRYRRISLNMDMRFPDATDEEIERDEHCVICRDSLFEGSKAKKLPCGHIFHIDCLRSWLVMQQVCPTCRAEISADTPIASMTPAALAAQAHSAAAAAAAAAATAAVDAAQAAGAAAPPAVHAQQAQAAATVPLIPPGGELAAPAATGAAMAGPSGPPRAANATPSGAAPAAASCGCAAAKAAAPVAAPAAGGQPQFQPQQAAVAKPPAPAPSSMPAPVPAAASAAAIGATPAAAVPNQPAAMAAAAGLGVLAGETGLAGVIGAMPPVNDIIAALKQGEEMTKFLKQQTDFWMDQVRLIEQGQAQGVNPFAVPNNLTAAAPQWQMPPGMGLLPFAAGAGTAPTATAAASTSSTEEKAPAAAQTAPSSPSAAATAGGGEDGGNSSSQLADLQRLQQERWKKHAASNVSSTGGEAGNEDPR